ncbi:MAG: hypothetical protein AAB546_03275, partial [Patescibacteria group bacterium]
LSKKDQASDYQIIAQKLAQEPGSFRSAWFPERQPLTFETEEKPALDGITLVNLYPFARLNAGEDWYNFLYNSEFVEWFRILGVKYLILGDDPRAITKDQKEKTDWQIINDLVQANKSLEKQDWETAVDVYKINESYPRAYFTDKIYATVGQPLKNTLPAIYFEDGKWDPTILEGKDPKSLKIYFNGSDKLDLTLSFLQKYFVTPGQVASKNEWASYSAGDYLKYKYELTIRGHNFTDFDYGRGISFSTQQGEKISFERLEQNNNLIFVRRAQKGENLHWESFTGQVLENKSGFEIVNVFAIVPKEEFAKAQSLADTFVTHFGSISSLQLEKETVKVHTAEFTKFGTLNYKFSTPSGSHWLILNENYHPLWQLRLGSEYFDVVPVYSLVNGFYVEDKYGDTAITFKGQENVRWGMYFSLVSILILTVFFLWKKSKESLTKT